MRREVRDYETTEKRVATSPVRERLDLVRAVQRSTHLARDILLRPPFYCCSFLLLLFSIAALFYCCSFLLLLLFLLLRALVSIAALFHCCSFLVVQTTTATRYHRAWSLVAQSLFGRREVE
eukprot:TRINITY_DN5149_c0_g1_i1.p1 TRINITY_DN5149_c0_g1~~TRINITY_DN5149_c0_g1_i1.p1  ORF type:complete len:121 (-),score=27.81 TRINITY_DN5149_c0_g1_i1:168-530(-)